MSLFLRAAFWVQIGLRVKNRVTPKWAALVYKWQQGRPPAVHPGGLLLTHAKWLSSWT